MDPSQENQVTVGLDKESSYSAGVCNIGPAEIERRKRSGWIGIGLTVLLATGFLVWDVSPMYRLFLGVPAGIGAAGFLQARLRFCAAFGLMGIHDMSEGGGRRRRIPDAGSRTKDLLASARIMGLSAAVAIMVAAAAYLL